MSVYLCRNCDGVKGVKGTAGIFAETGNDKFDKGEYRTIYKCLFCDRSA